MLSVSFPVPIKEHDRVRYDLRELLASPLAGPSPLLLACGARLRLLLALLPLPRADDVGKDDDGSVENLETKLEAERKTRRAWREQAALCELLLGTSDDGAVAAAVGDEADA
jgi:hypothetical protein